MTYTATEKLAELKRELSLRRAVYPSFVKSGQIKQVAADRQIGIIREIMMDYERLIQADTDLFHNL
jgi:hypothetical protein